MLSNPLDVLDRVDLRARLAQARRHRGPLPPGPAAAVLLVSVALLTRLALFGNPLLDSDEGFDLLVGDRLLHGTLPYVAIWDHKPVGLFLLYAGMRALGGDGVLACQLVGTAVVAATAILIAGAARHCASRTGATAAGILYLAWLPLASAAGGQAETFFGLPVCAAGVLTLRALLEPVPRRIALRGVGPMLLLGIALQIKYSAVFEGVSFGCCWLALAWRSGPRRTWPLLGLLWVLVALAPTALAAAYYWHRGALAPFLFANFQSIWLVRKATFPGSLGPLAYLAALLSPLLACVRPLRIFADRQAFAAHRFALAWLAAAIGGVLLLGFYRENFVLPVAIPASIAAASVLGTLRRWRLALLIGAVFVLGQVKQAVTLVAHGSHAQLQAILADVDPHRCLFVYSGFAALYRLTGSCIPTRFAFPGHLSRAREARAIGADPVAEIARIMRTRPGTVIVRSPYRGDENWAERAALFHALRQGYRPVFHGRLGWQTVDVYRPIPAPNRS